MYLEILKPAIDSFGLIAQLPSANRDGGDTFQREGMFAIGIECLYRIGKISKEEYQELRNRYIANLDRLEHDAGNYLRHIDPSMWYSFPDRMSRDQWTPNVIAMGMMKIKNHLRRTFLGHLFKRALLFTTNTRRNWTYPPDHPKHAPDQDYSWKLPDLTALSSWGFYIRSFRAWPLYPLLFIFDLDMLVSSFIWRYKFKNVPKDTDVLNHLNSMLQARLSMPTPLSWLARKILSVDKVQECLDRYFAVDGPAINEVFRYFLKDIW